MLYISVANIEFVMEMADGVNLTLTESLLLVLAAWTSTWKDLRGLLGFGRKSAIVGF